MIIILIIIIIIQIIINIIIMIIIIIIIITPTSSPRAMMSPSGRSGTPGGAVAASGAKSSSPSTWNNGTPSAIKAGQATEARSARGDPPHRELLQPLWQRSVATILLVI